MVQYSRLDLLNALVDTGLVPIFYNGDVDSTRQIVTALAAGGVRLVEFTNRGDFAAGVFSEVARHCAREGRDVILGAGSILDAPTAALYIANGANFIVGPSFNPEIARLCNRRKIAYVPGCATASEISAAEELGVEFVKVFPGESVGGPDFVRAILGPCPWTRILVTGGVAATPESINAWFSAGVGAVGIGSDLIRKEWLQSGDYAAITRTAQQVLGWITAARRA